jgi:hypothetical protein
MAGYPETRCAVPACDGIRQSVSLPPGLTSARCPCGARDTVEALRDRRANVPDSANNLVKRLRAMFRRAIVKRIGGVAANPCDHVERLTPKG